MKIKEIRELGQVELADREKHLKEELFNLRFQVATGQLTAVNRLGAVRKEIARIKTIVRENQLRGEQSSVDKG